MLHLAKQDIQSNISLAETEWEELIKLLTTNLYG